MKDGTKGLCLVCNKTFSRIDVARNHFKKAHLEQQPMNCPICQQEFPSKNTCDQHVIKDHKITLAEVKASKFFAITEDGQSGLTILENGKVICSVCSKAFSRKDVGKNHFKKQHCINEQAINYKVKNDGNISNGHPEEFETNQEFVSKVEMPEVGQSMVKSDLGNNNYNNYSGKM